MNCKPITISSLLSGLFSLLITGCFEAPDFPDTPRIAFENVEFKEGNSIFDSLIISIHYEDGDGDLGLDASFKDSKYREGSYYTFNGKDLISIRDVGKPINVKGFSGTVVPPYVRPYTCVNWVEKPVIRGKKINDTLFYVPNSDHFNIFVKFLYREKGVGKGVPFLEFDWIGSEELQDCGSPINGRFPVLKAPSKGSGAIEGTLRYGFFSSGLIPLFKDREIKLEVFIQDRKLQKSNTITITGNKKNDNGVGFTLGGIQAN